ncbi:MAG TPA: tRNA (guanosine(37)-N1)-methyltransferase TrmD [Actinocrinis sp.]|jgi:tRNA (guanine37-N1)-methyltransferase|uniref:tRNA (guanosine(37)-N1)-methyltransferase TrmD n=1 Tax=Actinocrinis sp. TaxID=1920516 RepID=UPI002DDCE6D1|nr:tRNA (guanosine(37)-N1)-methyltransferase TrmD [Actinocrinis sp.]HEV3174304.1 tRNA (guanosine(37)-N1)-methyltransferase TrmD [Actinocrinis sp.]
MRIDVVTIFPEYLAPLGVSLIGKAAERRVLEIRTHDLRQWTSDVHRTVDDSPYGGGPGMVMKPEPWGDALDAITANPLPESPEVAPTLVVPTPSGRPFTQAKAAELAERSWLIFACGRYEGIDRRAIEAAADRMPVEELSLGDYVLAGGEVAVLVMVEAIGRLLPGVLGNADSARDDSFAAGPMESLLEGPVYTKPAQWRGRGVPEILTSGNHGAIARWRRDQALARTVANRPELLARLDPVTLDKYDRATLAGLGWEVRDGRVERTEAEDFVDKQGS